LQQHEAWLEARPAEGYGTASRRARTDHRFSKKNFAAEELMKKKHWRNFITRRYAMADFTNRYIQFKNKLLRGQVPGKRSRG
jgi:hypothetical protein